MRSLLLWSMVLTSCSGVIDGRLPAAGGGDAAGSDGGATGGGGGGGGTAGASGGGATTGGGSAVPGDLPCDVATLLAGSCTSCHGSPLTGGAPFSLLSRADLVREVTPGVTAVSRSIARMKLAAAPMPPSPLPAPSAQDIAVLESWVTAGMPAGTCASGTPDAGPAPLTCLSMSTWTQANLASDDMNPGLACQSCHRGQNFGGQNPGLVSKLERTYFFMGTVFRGLNEQNLCNAALTGTVEIEITGADGVRITTMQARPGSGNFFSDGETPESDRLLLSTATLSLPYTAKVRANGMVREMRTPQMSGDCNLCHTERGAQAAPGRIVAP